MRKGLLLAPAVWLGALFIAPLLVVFAYSFFERGAYGELIPALQFVN